MKRLLVLYLILFLIVSPIAATVSQDILIYDTVIVNGFMIDGTDSVGFKADIGIKDGKIVDIGDLKEAKCHNLIDAEDNIVASGFIDIHAHTDDGIQKSPQQTTIFYRELLRS